MRPVAVGQADEQEAVFDVGVGLLAEGEAERLGLCRRHTVANHCLSCPRRRCG
jgi:hypothetical protein